MAINLVKGQKIDLTKDNKDLKKIILGLGWDVNTSLFGGDFDLDASALLLNAQGHLPVKSDIVYYGNLRHNSGSVQHSGDNLTGGGDGDDEQIVIDLPKVPERVEKIVITVTIYEATKRRQSFKKVNNSYVRIMDGSTGKELIRYNLQSSFSDETSVIVGEVYRHNGEWKFGAVGEGLKASLKELAGRYGLR